MEPGSGVNPISGIAINTAARLVARSKFGAASEILDAVLQIGLVHSVIGAIHEADVASGKQFGAAGLPVSELPGGPQPTPARQALTPDPLYKPRQIIHPAPRYLPRAELDAEAPSRNNCSAARTVTPAPHNTFKLGVQPPWEILPWPTSSSRPVIEIKVIIRPTDTTSKGSLIDLFA